MGDFQIFSNVWAVIGPLLGVFLGSWLTTKNERKHWIADNKRAEYRMLLTTLSNAASKILRTEGNPINVLSPRDQREVSAAAERSANVIYNRLFIAREVEKLNVMERWNKALSAVEKNHGGIGFMKIFDGLMNDIRASALKNLS